MHVQQLREAIAAAGGTPASFATIPLLRQLVTVHGGTPTRYDIVGLLREAITASGGTPTKFDPMRLMRDLLTARSIYPRYFDERRLLGQLVTGNPELCVNGGFDGETGWTPVVSAPTEMFISGGKLNFVAATTTRTMRNSMVEITVVGAYYDVVYTYARTAGNFRPTIGGLVGTTRSTSGTFTERLGPTINGNDLRMSAFSGCTGTIDDVSCKRVA